MPESIFMTGVSGLIGDRCLIYALESGFHVFASVRSQTRADAVRRSVEGLANDTNLSLIIIPDMIAPHVFDDAVSKASYVIHVASPLWTTSFSLPQHELAKAWIEPAVGSTVAILEAATRSPSVKKVVLTSSLGALTTLDRVFGSSLDGKTYTANDRVPDRYCETMEGASAVDYYMAGKALALNATDRFVNENSPGFSIINIFPSSAIGRFEMAETPEQLLANSNIRGLAVAVGKDLGPIPSNCVHVDDLAKMHVDVLKMETPAYLNLGAGVFTKFSDQATVIEENFLEAVKKGKFPMGGKITDRPFSFECKDTEDFFQWKMKDYATMVKDCATQYLELLDRVR